MYLIGSIPTKRRKRMLPTAKSAPKEKIEDFTILLYGAPKIGKSSFCSKIPSTPLFLATEPGLNSLSVYQQPIPDWETFLKVCGEISKGNHDFKTIVIDTIDNLYKCCVSHVNTSMHVVHEADLPFGKGYSMIRNEFFRALTKLAMLQCGLIMIGHVKQEKVQTRTTEFFKSVPTIPTSVREHLLGWVDIILFADINADGERVLRTKPNEKYIAGDRTISLLGEMPDEVPFDFSQYSKAFYNRKGGK